MPPTNPPANPQPVATASTPAQPVPPTQSANQPPQENPNNFAQPEVPIAQPSGRLGQKSKKGVHIFKKSAVVVLLALVFVLIIWGAFNFWPKSASLTRQYGELIIYTSQESAKGSGFNFMYPADMQVTESSESKVLLEDLVPENKQEKVGLLQYSTIQAYKLKTGKLTNNGRTQLLNKVLENASDGNLEGGTSSSLVSNLVVGNFEAKKGNKNKYFADISYDVVPDEGTEGDIKQFAGKMLVAFGKDNTYFFIVQSENSTWNQNQDIWNSVIDSFRFDK